MKSSIYTFESCQNEEDRPYCFKRRPISLLHKIQQQFPRNHRQAFFTMNSSSTSDGRSSYDSFDFPPVPFNNEGEFYDEVDEQHLHIFTFDPSHENQVVNQQQSQNIVQEVKWFWKQAKPEDAVSLSSSSGHYR